jgi:hypothetical protein
LTLLLDPVIVPYVNIGTAAGIADGHWILLLGVAAGEVEATVLDVNEDIVALIVVETDVFVLPPLQPAIMNITTSNVDTKTITLFMLPS